MSQNDIYRKQIESLTNKGKRFLIASIVLYSCGGASVALIFSFYFMYDFDIGVVFMLIYYFSFIFFVLATVFLLLKFLLINKKIANRKRYIELHKGEDA